MAAILQNQYDVNFVADLFRQASAKSHADDGEQAKIKTGSRISGTGHSNIIGHGLRHLVKIWYTIVLYIPKCETSQNRKVEVDLRRYGRHLTKST